MRTSTILRLVMIVGALAVVGSYLTYTARAQDQVRHKSAMVINLTSGKEDLHAVTMALELAAHGVQDDRAVIVFLNVRAPELASKHFPTSLGVKGKRPIRDLMDGLLQQGVTLLSCPSCMDILGVKPADLVPGVELASREGLFGKLSAGSVVFSY